MKSLKTLFVGLVLLATALASPGDDKPTGQYWYIVSVAQPEHYQWLGTSPLAESDFARSLSNQDGFIKLDNLLYRDNNGLFKFWHEWNTASGARVYIRAKTITAFEPLVGDPRKVSNAAPK